MLIRSSLSSFPQERCLEWCLERLRYELDGARVAALAGHAEQLEESLTFARTENGQLCMALAKRTWNPFTRFLHWFRRVTAPTESGDSL
jgi:hypothetical protein